MSDMLDFSAQLEATNKALRDDRGTLTPVAWKYLLRLGIPREEIEARELRDKIALWSSELG